MDYNTLLFEAAVKLVADKGEQVPVQELDPFFESCRYYQDDILVVVSAIQLVGDEDGKLYRARRIIVQTLDFLEELAEADAEEVLLVDLSELPTVYDHYSREDGFQHTEIFIRGEWLRHLLEVREQV